MANLANKYRPRRFDEITEQSLVVQMVKALCESDTLDCRNFLFIGPAGTGKAQPLSSKVLTPQGFIEMRDVHIGTDVFTSTGAIATVVGLFPQGTRPIYKITLQDRTSIMVSDEHLNIFYRYNEDRKERQDYCMTTLELLEFFQSSRFKLRIDTPTIDWPHQPVPIDPYLLGALIGDGSLSSGNFAFSNSEEDVIAKVDSILQRDWNLKLKKVDGDNVDYDIVKATEDATCVPLKQILNSFNLLCKSVNKYIPECYLYNCRDVRLNLLQGLYDTDGYTAKGSVTEFTTCSSQLSQDFAFLVRSLGIRDTISSYPSRYKPKGGDWIYTGTTSYTHSLKIPNGLPYYSSNKHQSRYHDRQNPPLRNIVSIEYVGEEECQCIYVDHADHTYISDGFIPTHNTTLARCIGNSLNDNLGEFIEVDAASKNGVDSVRQIIEQARTYPVGMKYKIFILDEVHAFSQQAWQMLLKTLEESPAKSVFLMCTTNPEKIPGTILSRVQTFQLSKISLDGITNRLKYVIAEENKEGRNITYEDSAINYIGKLANGGMRDSLTLLDKALAYSTNITSEGLVEALNLPQYDDYFALLASYAKHDNTEIVNIIHKVYNSGVNFVKWFEGFHAFVMNVVKFIFIQDIECTMIPSHYKEKVSKYGPKHSVVCLKLANKLLKLNSELKTTPYLQETALNYLCSIPRKEG